MRPAIGRQAKGPAFPEDVPDASIDRVWIVQPGEADGVLYAGVAPAALFTSTDSGETWELNRGPVERADASRMEPRSGRARAALHLSVARRSATSGGGHLCGRRLALRRRRRDVADRIHRAGPTVRARRPGETGRTPSAYTTCTERPSGPSGCSCSSTASVYRSDDTGETWNDIAEGMPSGFGFPMVVDPSDPDNAYVVPLTADVDRVTPDGKVRVFETRDAAGGWTAHGDGLPVERCLPDDRPAGVRARRWFAARPLLRRHVG